MVVYSYGSYAERFFRWLEGVPDAAGLPRVWVYGGDMMDPAWRQRAESRGCAIVSTYQTVEAGRIGFECERRDGFHLNADLVAVRVVDEGGRDVAAGETGEIVISNLVNRATVLLNARLGDRGALSPDPCPCGRGLPLLRGLEGRVSEVVDLGDGRKIGEMDLRRETGDALDFALQVQLVQSRPGRVVWRVAPREGVAVEDAVRRLRLRMREIVGPGTEVGVDVVDEIPTPWSGKQRRVERGDG
jgi:phenylacetate-CoA ligase